MNCLFIQMPYSGLVRPSPALGILQAILRRGDIETETIYADLLFAASIGLELWSVVSAIPPHELLGDWTFSHLAFPDFHPEDDLFLKLVYDRNKPHIAGSFDSFKLQALALRKAASVFIDYLSTLISEKHPLIVGCGSTLQQHVPSLALLRRLREDIPGVTTLLGGANCETDMGQTTHRSFPWIDYVVSGEADALIVPLIRQILKHGRNVPEDKLPSCTFAPFHRRVGYPNDDGNVPRAVLESLEQQPLPDYSDYFRTLDQLRELKPQIRTSLPIETSRGCWYANGDKGGCSFCGLNGVGKRFRSMSPKKALHDIQNLSNKYNVDRIQAMDNVMNPVFIRKLLPSLTADGKNTRLWYEVRTNLKQKDIKAFYLANIRWIWAGIESLDDRLLDMMNKDSKAINNVRFLKACRQTGLFVGWNLMVDFPGDEDDWYSDMALRTGWLTHLQPPRALMRLRFDRFSRYHRVPSAYGLDLKPAALYPYIYPLPEEEMADLAYFFEDESRRLYPRFADLLTRPGIKALTESAALWARRFHSPASPRLTLGIKHGQPVIHDTRSFKQEYRLAEIENDILLACDDGISMKELSNRLEASNYRMNAIKTAVKKLTDYKLLMFFADDCIALPLREPVPELPGRNEYPGGYTGLPNA